LISAYASVGQTNRVFQLLESTAARKPNDFSTIASVAQAYMQLQRTNDAVNLLNRIAKLPNLDAGALTTLAHLYSQLGQVGRLEESLTRLTTVMPDSPEAWYDLAAIRSVLGNKQPEALKALSKAIQLSNARLTKDAKASNLQAMAQKDDRFLIIRKVPGYAQALQGAL
jgi:tetratricopeptide (TPR) repeat protein